MTAERGSGCRGNSNADRPIETLVTTQPAGPFQCLIAGLLLAGCKRRLLVVETVAPGWVMRGRCG